MMLYRYSLSPADKAVLFALALRRIYSFHRMRSPTARNMRCILGGMLLIFAGGAYATLFGALACVFVPAIAALILAMIIRALLRGHKPRQSEEAASPQVEYVLRIEGNIMEITGVRGVRTLWKRSTIKYWREHRTVFTFVDSSYQFRCIPTSTMSAEQVDELRAWFR